MQVGDVVGGRFELEALAGAGGMGEVFRARDRATGEVVAVKVMSAGHGGDPARFEREVRILSELRHPGVVRLVAHGATLDSGPYLAMEWLEGEDLRCRLARQRLSVEQSVALAAGVAEALAAAHARDVVHRDLKPSNLFLVRGDVAQVKVLDFGIAQLGETARLTRTGVILGTPEYMAPEQARGDAALDARVDVFALGCVLFECLTGARAFTCEHLMAVLAKILFEEAPRVAALRGEVPRALDALVARMLAKEPALRPRDGASVAAALSALDLEPPAGEALAGRDAASLTGGERRVVSVVMLGRELPARPDEAQAPDAPRAAAVERDLRRAAAAFGGRLEVFADGSAAVTLAGAFVATDQAAQAARCALALHALAPRRPMGLATGRSETTGRLPVGEAVDRAAGLVARCGGARPVILDEVTAGLLDARFEVARSAAGLELLREREIVEEARTLLGKRTACVGRERELETLVAFLAECLEERAARAALVTAPAGVGKSRLFQELLGAARQRGEPIEIWVGRGDAQRSAHAFGPLGQALRGACEIREDDPPEARRQKLRARVARRVAPADQARVTVFLGELAGASFPEEESAPLRAARRQAEHMSEEIRRAWEDFLLAECAARPVLLALDDLHWADGATVKLVDAALRIARRLPFMALASARPEVHELFPRLWAGRELREIRLRPLPPKASGQLVRQVLGDSVSPETVAHLVSRSQGHAFYLEELIRAVAEGRGGALPETVMAMVQASLERFDPEARRVLRAASIFGEVFWQGAVEALLGGGLGAGGPSGGSLASLLGELVQKEMLMRRRESRFAGEPELAFRHALLLEGAYAMLTEQDRALGHRLAGQWLEQRGESAPSVLGEHFERGGELARAAGFYLRAAEQAKQWGDGETAIASARRGLACDASGELRVALMKVLWEADLWSQDLASGDAGRDAEQMMRLTTPGSESWVRGALLKLFAALATGKLEELTAMMDAVRAARPLPEAIDAIADTLNLGISHLLITGHADLARSLLTWLEALVKPVEERAPRARGLLDVTRAVYAMWVDEEPWSGLRWAESALAWFKQGGSPMDIAHAHLHIGVNLWFLGAFARAERALRAAHEAADEGSWLVTANRSLYLAAVLVEQGALEEGCLIAGRLLEEGRARRSTLQEGFGRWMLVEIFRRRGDLDAAEQEAVIAREQLATLPNMKMPLITSLAVIRLAKGRVVEALAGVEEAMAGHRAFRMFGCKGSFARLVHAEALKAAGDHERALAAIAEARASLLVNAAKIGDAELRRSFLEDIPENARTFELARQWLGEA